MARKGVTGDPHPEQNRKPRFRWSLRCETTVPKNERNRRRKTPTKIDSMNPKNKPSQTSRSETTQRPERRIVYVTMPACPECGSGDVRAYKTIAQGDGSKFRYTRCNQCGERFEVVAELISTK